MISFLAMHALAAPRGDGLRPELVALLERHEAAPNADLAMAVSEQLQADAAKKAALVPYPVRLPLNQKT